MTSSVEIWRWFGGLSLLIVAAIVSAVLALLLRPLLARYALARPNARSSHKTPTPQGAGIAVIASTFGVAFLVLLAASVYGPDISVSLWTVFAATVLIAVVGAVDDIRNIAIVPRLFLQTIAVAAVIVALPDDLRAIPLLPLWLERAVLLLAGVWFVNLVNFMDGIDWMTVAEVVPVTAGFALIGALVGLPPAAMIVALALLGAVLGFAPFNRPVAQMFLGDVGSLPIGLLLFWLLVVMAGSAHIAAALILPLYYVADATLTLLRRMRDHEPFWQAHRTHFYQRATDRGYTVTEVVARVFATNIALVALALFTVLVPGIASAFVALACAAALVGWLLFVLARGKR